MKKHSSLKVATAAALLTVTFGALAADGKDYAGIVCVPDQTRVPAGHANGTLQVFGSTVMNISTTEDLYVSCPFVHDQNNIGSGTLWAYDRTNTAAVECQLRSEIHNAAGQTIFTSANGSSGLGTNQANAVAVPFGAVSTGTFNFASCVIPKKNVAGASGGVSHIAGFNVVEN